MVAVTGWGVAGAAAGGGASVARTLVIMSNLDERPARWASGVVGSRMAKLSCASSRSRVSQKPSIRSAAVIVKGKGAGTGCGTGAGGGAATAKGGS